MSAPSKGEVVAAVRNLAERLRPTRELTGAEREGIAAALDALADALASEATFVTTRSELAVFARWLIAMDDPNDADGMRARQTITLTRIIAQARAALAADSEGGQP